MNQRGFQHCKMARDGSVERKSGDMDDHLNMDDTDMQPLESPKAPGRSK